MTTNAKKTKSEAEETWTAISERIGNLQPGKNREKYISCFPSYIFKDF